MQDHELSALMYAETDNAPPARVDLARTMRDGRRRRRWRRTGPALAAVAVLAVGAGTVALVSRPPGPAVVAPPPSNVPVQAAPDVFDPLRLRVSAGWVPDGLVRQDPLLANGYQQLAWLEPVGAMQNPQRQVYVTIYVAGLEPWQVGIGGRTRQATDPVRGAEAFWLVTTAENQPTALAWRWAPNAWAVAYVQDEDAAAVARRVAESVRTDLDEPLRLPFTVKRPPASLHLTQVSSDAQPPQYSVSLWFEQLDAPIAQPGRPGDPGATLTVTWVPPGATNKDTPNRTLDGSPAAVHWDSPDWGDITLYRNGYEVTLSIPSPAVRHLVDEATAIAIVTSVTPVGAPTDRTHWTETPLVS